MEACRPRPGSQTKATIGCPRGLAIALVLPAFDEEASIAAAIRAADAALARITANYEIIVVDDGSRYGTLAAAQAIASELPAVRVIPHDGNQGYGAALRTGFAAATKEYVGFTDADGQFDLTELDRLAMLAPHYDLVCGYRIDRQDDWHRRFLSQGYSLLTRILLGTGVRDCDCALKLMCREAVGQLGLQSSDFFINAELLAKARLQGLSVVEIGVTHRPRERGESKVSPWDVVRVLAALLPFWWNAILFPSRREAETQRGPSTPAWCAWLLAAAAVLLLFSRLTYPLIEPDEARYALMSSEMLSTGDWLIPARDGQEYLDKPPLLYWLTAASFGTWGTSDASARLVTACAALCTWLATWLLGRRLVGARGAQLGALLLLMSLGFLLSGRFLIMDGVLTSFTTLGLLAAFLATRGPRLHLGWWLAAAAATGLGLMTKGPVALVLVVPPLVAHRWLSGAGASIGRWHLALFAAVVAAIATPWFVLAAIREPHFVEYFLWQHHVMRYMSNFSHAAPWWFYAPVLMVGMFPASLLLPLWGVYLFSRRPAFRAGRTPEQGYLLLSALWTLVFFSLSSGKLAPYLLPALPMLCLALGAMLETIIFSPAADSLLARIRAFVPFHAARTAMLCGVAVGVAELVIGRQSIGGVSIGAALIGGSVFAFRVVSRESFGVGHARWLAAAAAALVALGVGLIDLYPRVAAQRSTGWQVAQYRRQRNDFATPLVSFLRYEDGLAFYNRDRKVQAFLEEDLPELMSFLAQHDRVLLVTPKNGVAILRARLPQGVVLQEQDTARGQLYVAVSGAGQGERLSASKAGGDRK